MDRQQQWRRANGLGLEEVMLPVLAEIAARVPVVPVSADIETIDFGEAGEADHNHAAHESEEHADEEHADEEHEDATEHHYRGGVDPHSWQSVPTVLAWTHNI